MHLCPEPFFLDPCFSQTASLLPFGRRALWQNRMNWCFQMRFLACKIRETTQGVIRVKSLVGRVESCICTNLYVDILYICNIIYWYIMMYFIYVYFCWCMIWVLYIYTYLCLYCIFIHWCIYVHVYILRCSPVPGCRRWWNIWIYMYIYTYIHRPLDYISKKNIMT